MPTTHTTLTLDLNVDCAEFCPTPAFLHLLAVGTYQLDEATQTRHGQLILYKLQQDADQGAHTLQGPVATVHCAGILNCKWLPADAPAQPPAIALALADGTVQVATFVGEDLAGDRLQGGGEVTSRLVGCSCRGDDDSAALALSVDHQQAGHYAEQLQLASTCSDGCVCLLQMTPAALSCVSRWQGHSLEAWMAAFDPHQEGVLYSGADDDLFKGWDCRCSPASPSFVNKEHGAGVTAIAPHPRTVHLVATGSYDSAARLWDMRNQRRPLCSAQLDCGGGVWRLKWHPSEPSLLLAACMHDGFKVLRSDAGGSSGLEVVEHYEQQRTLAYGADWCRQALPHGASLAATASFYDRQLHLWSPDVRA